MVNYNKICIYKIQHNTNKNIFYIGHTTSFKTRRATHRYFWNKRSNEVYDMIRENGGWENFQMSLIKEFPCKTILELDIEKSRIQHQEEMRAYLTSLNL